MKLTMPVDERLDEFTTVKFVIIIGVMHLKVMELKFLFCHFAGVNLSVQMFAQMFFFVFHILSVQNLTLRIPVAGMMSLLVWSVALWNLLRLKLLNRNVVNCT